MSVRGLCCDISVEADSVIDIGAIVGGTVGGVVGLLAILLLLWFCVFKKRRDRKGDFDDQMVCFVLDRLPLSAADA